MSNPTGINQYSKGGKGSSAKAKPKQFTQAQKDAADLKMKRIAYKTSGYKKFGGGRTLK